MTSNSDPIGEDLIDISGDDNSEDAMIITETTNWDTFDGTRSDTTGNDGPIVCIDIDDNTDGESETMAANSAGRSVGHALDVLSGQLPLKPGLTPTITVGHVSGSCRYACLWPDCGYETNYRHHMLNHSMAHRNLRPYRCQWPGCHYRTNWPTNVAKHSLFHRNPGYRWGSRQSKRLSTRRPLPVAHHSLTIQTPLSMPINNDCLATNKTIGEDVGVSDNGEQHDSITTTTSGTAVSSYSRLIEVIVASANEIDGNNRESEDTGAGSSDDSDGKRSTLSMPTSNECLAKNAAQLSTGRRSRGRPSKWPRDDHSADTRPQYACDWPQCTYRSPNRCIMTNHMNAHRNVRPYRCDWLGCQYRSSFPTISVHRRTHTRDRSQRGPNPGTRSPV